MDRGSPPQTGSAVLTIIIQDENNQPPAFLADLYRVTLSEGKRLRQLCSVSQIVLSW